MREHAEAVREAGHRVVVVHLAGSSPDLGRSLWAMEQELDSRLTEGIETYHVCHRRVPVRRGSYPLYLWSAFSAHRRLRDAGFRPEIIHAHVYGAGVPAAIIAGRTRVPLVITEHFSGVALRSLGRVEARKARFAYSRAARILPVSQFLQDAIRSYDVHRPFEVVPNVVDSSVFFPPAEGSRPDSVRRLLFVGNLEPMHLKGFPTLLRALLLLREQRQDWRLDVIGDGPERERHEKSAVELDLGGYVTFHGSRPKPAVAQAMRTADLLLLPSSVETFGAVVAEALVSGLPVVSTNVGGIPELVEERNGRLVPPEDPAAFAQALTETLENLDIFDRMAIAAAASDRHSRKVVGERLSRIYASALAESRVHEARRAGPGETVSS